LTTPGRMGPPESCLICIISICHPSGTNTSCISGESSEPFAFCSKIEMQPLARPPMFGSSDEANYKVDKPLLSLSAQSLSSRAAAQDAPCVTKQSSKFVAQLTVDRYEPLTVDRYEPLCLPLVTHIPSGCWPRPPEQLLISRAPFMAHPIQ
jgi:hypothetical protein